VFWGAGDELSQELPLLPFLDVLRVREASASSRRTMIVRLLRGEVIADRADVPAVLAEQLLALVGVPVIFGRDFSLARQGPERGGMRR
jgi:hypothetical protein